MFSLSEAAVFAAGVAVVLIMPGPTNTLLAAAGLNQGLKRAARLTLAELTGYTLAISVWGFFLGQAAQMHAWMPGIMRAVSGAYVAYLAIHLWRSAPAMASAQARQINMRTLFVATSLNPKAILFAGTIFPAAAFHDAGAYTVAMLMFTVLLLPIGTLWVAFGAQLGTGRLRWLEPSRVQRGASLVLGAFSLSLAWAALR